MMIALVSVVVVAVVMAWALTQKRPEHLPIAIVLSVQPVSAVLVKGFDLAVVASLRNSLGVSVPWTGWAWVASLVNNGLQLVFPAVLVAVSVHLFTKKTPWLGALGWMLAMAYFVVAHPIAGDGSQARTLMASDALAALISTGLAAQWYARTKKPGTSAQYAIALVASAELCSLLGAWRVGFSQWPVSQVLYLALYGALIVTQGRMLWTSPRLQPSS
jgi:hypothetical protein